MRIFSSAKKGAPSWPAGTLGGGGARVTGTVPHESLNVWCGERAHVSGLRDMQGTLEKVTVDDDISMSTTMRGAHWG